MTEARLSRQAARDLADTVAWLIEENPSAARAFRQAFEKTARRLRKYPKSGAVRPDLADESVRFSVIPGWPYIIVYDAEITPPLILRVLHGSRDLARLLKAE